MRKIILLPLTTRQALVYCQKAIEKPTSKPSIADRITKKAAETWAQWETAKKGWRKTLVYYGNQGLQRIPYQEWGLKSFPPSNPKLQAEQITEGRKFDVIFPSNVMHKEDVPKVLARLARERKQLHWNRFIGSMVAMPICIPFALVPILYRPVSPPEIEDLYEQVAPDAPDFTFVTSSQVLDGTAPPEQIILPAECHNLVAKVTGVPELSGEVERAVWQIQRQFKREQSQQEKQKRKQLQEPPKNDAEERDPKKKDSGP
ncbi:hypothetical protein CLCR_10535 [Cladophialophora carrionii]|uniref:Uncharacterized protein n=1 Tax=Cladophialophora carrionii TaxID=86049 RepID=A0A1C1CY25_9EURO|nr:hypothetical protein CLCR_10535 [Cladophialophora carrionii]